MNSHNQCPMCSFWASSARLLVSHLRIFHSNDPNFNVSCGIEGCARSYRTFSAFYSHIYRCHRNCGIVCSKFGRLFEDLPSSTGAEVPLSTEQPDDADAPLELQEASLQPQQNSESDPSVQADLDYLMGNSDQKRIAALFLLKLKEERRLTQVAVDDVVTGVTSMIEHSVCRVKAGLRAKLSDIGIDMAEMPGLEKVFSDLQQPFNGLETAFKQEKYYKDSLSLLEPQEIRVGDPTYLPRFSGDKRQIVPVWDTFQYVPIMETLTQLLQDQTVREEIDNFSNRAYATDSTVLEDVCDGSRFRNHPLFSVNPRALQIIGYYDEIEVCNPLGSHVKKHKLGIIFFTLGNIRPKFRSSFRAINLVAIANSSIVQKYGLNSILRPFIDDLNHLSTVGMTVSYQGEKEVYKGALLTFLADNLAANELGGFKLSFSFSYRFCRCCLMPKDKLTSSFNSNDFCLRTTEKHEEHCELLVGPAGSHFSKTYGINVRSALLDVKYFSMFDGGLPCDCLHDILEGIAPHEIKLLMSHCISSKYFKLDQYNSRLLHYDFGYTETDKPTIILSQALSTGSLRTTASQMLVLLRNLPYLIGDYVPENDENWRCFLLLRRIVDIVMCPKVNQGLCATLKFLIEEHHSLYITLYGTEFYVPKFHIITHYPEQILAVGPMLSSWTMRHEGKLNFFKQASRLSNFKNVAQSVARRHQRWFCYESASNNLFSIPLECGPGGNPTSLHNESEDMRSALLSIIPDVSFDCTIFRPSWVSYNKTVYKVNNCFLIKGTDGLDPIFVRLLELLVIHGSQLVFVVQECKVLYFDDHYHSYVIQVLPDKSAIIDLYDHHVYHSHKIENLLCISLRYYFN